jgi:hypothetical protein
MTRIVSIEPVGSDPGLIAFECLQCRHVTSEIVLPHNTA